MADDKKGDGGGGGSSLSFVLFLMIAVIGAWFLSGAAKNADFKTIFFTLPGTTNPFSSSTLSIIEAPTVEGVGTGPFDPVETNEVTGEVAAVRKEVARLASYPISPFTGQITIEATSGGKVTNAPGEYIILHASVNNKTPVVITNWRLESAVSKKTAFIRTGIDTYLQGGVGAPGAIVLNPGDEAIVSTTRSPVGESFRVNKCSGYLTQFQQFTPTLKTDCPLPEEEALDTGTAFAYNDSECAAHLTRIPSCSIDLSPPQNLTSQCKSFIYNHLTYQGCINNHKSDSNFRSSEWRVFLGFDTGLWRENREVLTLLDSQGKLVDSATY